MLRWVLHAAAGLAVVGSLGYGSISLHYGAKAAVAAAPPVRECLARAVPAIGEPRGSNGGPINATTGTFSGAMTAASYTATAASGSNAITITSGSRINMGGSCLLRVTAGVLYAVDCDLGTSTAGTDVSSARTLISNAGSGSNALTVVTNGARVDFGTGSTDYAESDGTVVSFAGAVRVVGVQYVDSGRWFGGGTASTFVLNATGSSSIAGVTSSNSSMNLYPRVALDTDDLILNVLDGTPTSQFTLDNEGDLVTGAIDSTDTRTVGTITLVAGTGTATVQSGAVCVCSDTSAVPLVTRCAVSGTTLTATQASGTNVVAYHCL